MMNGLGEFGDFRLKKGVGLLAGGAVEVGQVCPARPLGGDLVGEVRSGALPAYGGNDRELALARTCKLVQGRFARLAIQDTTSLSGYYGA